MRGSSERPRVVGRRPWVVGRRLRNGQNFLRALRARGKVQLGFCAFWRNGSIIRSSRLRLSVYGSGLDRIID